MLIFISLSKTEPIFLVPLTYIKRIKKAQLRRAAHQPRFGVDRFLVAKVAKGHGVLIVFHFGDTVPGVTNNFGGTGDDRFGSDLLGSARAFSVIRCQ